MDIKNLPYNKIVRWLWALFGGGLVLFIIYIFLVSINFLNLFGEMPGFKELENPKSELASELYTSDGTLLGKYFHSNRSKVSWSDLSPNVRQALLATEDYRFKKHPGIDLTGLLRVFVKTIILQQDAGGGSTITQQLAKNLFDTRKEENQGLLSNIPGIRLLIIKTKEWITAVRLEREYTKREIMTMYLNSVHFGSNTSGIKVAARTFFNTETDSLKVHEAATLIGLLKAPTYYSPIQNPENCRQRRNVVIHQMAKYNFIEPKTADSLQQLPLQLKYSVENQNKGMATYFRSYIKRFLRKWCRKAGYDLYSDGLKIHTTINSRMQKHAEQAVKEHMTELQDKFFDHWGDMNPWNYKGDLQDNNKEKYENYIPREIKKSERYGKLKKKYPNQPDSVDYYMNKERKMTVFSWEGEKDTTMSPVDSIKYYKHFLHTGFMSMDPHNGKIKAWVGGINHKYFKYDHVKQGKRQPGSTFKPFVYTTALSNGYSPCKKILDAPVTFYMGDTTWTPKNAGVNGYTGKYYTLKEGMAKSINSITTRVTKLVTPLEIVKTARRMGIKSHLEATPSISLGTFDLSVYELVGAYSVFANQGTYTEPYAIVRIEDKHGNVIERFVPDKREAINQQVSDLMIDMLKAGTEPGGTSWRLHRYKGLFDEENEIGGKTGTTQNNSDGWYMGVTPDLVSGAWVGGEDRVIHFKSLKLGQGASMALPIWARYMQKVYKDDSLDIKRRPFPAPSYNIETDCEKVNNEQGTESDSTNSSESAPTNGPPEFLNQ